MTFLMRYPELSGFLLGAADLLVRPWAKWLFEPSEARRLGMLLLGNVPHHREIRALGLETMVWFGIAACVLAVMYAGLRLAERLGGASNAGFLACRFFLAGVAGVLAINVLEAATTGAVTNYVGLAYSGRFTMLNLGDLVLWACLLGFLPAACLAAMLMLRTQGRPG
ncbi:MAG: hypothetical protein KA187_00220 [Arenimonas sp.]|nr:hypothetical protein [Arenimonas sp.]